MRTLLYLLNDYDEQGVILAKSAKEVANVTDQCISETYKTLDILRELDLIWRVGRRKLYRYGLKTGSDLDQLLELFRCIKYSFSLPKKFISSYETLDQLREVKKQRKRNLKQLREIEQQLKAFEVVPEEQRHDIFEKTTSKMASKIIDDFVYDKGDKEAILEFAEKKVDSIWDEIIGARRKEDL